ncbi:MAG TPA: uracil-DNA glycosylase family protein, partial [Opitutaceae bacterium]|nr:uracil-DNA glycosylase family protein [Opitutaceae bacterium]
MVPPPVLSRPVSSGVMLVGQAPGDKEPRLGRPFAWTAGKTLFRWFQEALGWTEEQTRDRLYFAAVCRCFPGKNPGGGDRVPAPEEIAACRPWLEAEFDLLTPRLIIPVGKLALSLFVPPAPLVDVIGKRFTHSRKGQAIDVIPLPHPSGASPWPRIEPGRSLLHQAMAHIAAHPVIQRLT